MSEQTQPVAEGWREIESLQLSAIDRMFAAKSKGVGVRLSAEEVVALCIGVLANAQST